MLPNKPRVEEMVELMSVLRQAAEQEQNGLFDTTMQPLDPSRINYERLRQCNDPDADLKRPVRWFDPQNYYQYLGFRLQRLRREPAETMAGYVRRSNPEFFGRNEPVHCRVIVVDGTCATGKSSLSGDMRKTNKHLSCVGQNFHPSGHLGYIFSSLKMMAGEQSVDRLYDRLPWNNLTWSLIWPCIADSLCYPDQYPADMGLSADKQRMWTGYAEFVNPTCLEPLVAMTKNILVINSDEEDAHASLANRGEEQANATDSLRAQWPMYIRAQNFFYLWLRQTFPAYFCLVDLYDFDGNKSLMQATVDELANDIFRDMRVVPSELIKFEPCTVTMPKHWLMSEEKHRERLRPMQTLYFTEAPKHSLAADAMEDDDDEGFGDDEELVVST